MRIGSSLGRRGVAAPQSNTKDTKTTKITKEARRSPHRFVVFVSFVFNQDVVRHPPRDGVSARLGRT
jgi:hypothetical protein